MYVLLSIEMQKQYCKQKNIGDCFLWSTDF